MGEESDTGPAVEAREVRVLDGPNLYFTRPALKVRLGMAVAVDLPTAAATRLARSVGLASARPGAPGSAWRRQFLARVVRQVLRRMALEAGVTRLAVRARPGPAPDEVVVAVPWRHRSRAVVAGRELAPLLHAVVVAAGRAPGHIDQGAVDALVSHAIAEAAATVAAADPGPVPTVLTPTVPVVSITGTNGKTTTTRLVAHMAMTAGRTTAWSSTDGVVVMGAVVEPGDYSGPAGARAVLQTPGLEIGILETARGGLLLKGMGVSVNDVSVVTNVSADHLGLHGIETLDQLAEVKAIVTTVTKPGGWTVLNGEDPRTWAMRGGSPGKPWAFALDSAAPALREAREAHGRAITVLDGDIVVIGTSGDMDRLVPVVDVPITVAGLARHNVANALAAAAAALAVGIPRQAVVAGLRSFLPDPVLSAGRLNVYSMPSPDGSGALTVIVDMAHNEAGLAALLDVADGLRPSGALVYLGLGTAGDRPDEALVGLGEIAGTRADRVVIVDKEHYLRGRTTDEMAGHFRAGLSRVGSTDVAQASDEIAGLDTLVAAAHAGDVVVLMCHSDRPLVERWLAERGSTVDGPDDIRRKVVTARGEHPLEPVLAHAGRLDPHERADALRDLLAGHPGDARVTFELAVACDAGGDWAAAVALYRSALAAGLPEPHAHRAKIQAAACLRALGQPTEALTLLDDVLATHPGLVSATGFRALVLRDIGRADEAVDDLVRALAYSATDDETRFYRAALTSSRGSTPHEGP
jgi:cyanophycin synthetase